MIRSTDDARSRAPRDEGFPERELAGLFPRACALALDLAVAAALAWSAGLAASALGAGELASGARAEGRLDARALLAWSAVHGVPAWLLLTLLEGFPGRAGIGKRLLRLRVATDPSGAPPSLARVALRTAIKLLPWNIAALALFLPRPWDPRDAIETPRLIVLLGANLWIGLYLASAAMTRRRQSLHDLAAGTVVVRARAAPAHGGRGPGALPSSAGDG